MNTLDPLRVTVYRGVIKNDEILTIEGRDGGFVPVNMTLHSEEIELVDERQQATLLERLELVRRALDGIATDAEEAGMPVIRQKVLEAYAKILFAKTAARQYEDGTLEVE